MTILAMTDVYLVEFEFGQLTIARYSDGRYVAMDDHSDGRKFKQACRDHGREKAIAIYLEMLAPLDWRPLYKPASMQRPMQRKEPHA